MHRSMTPAVPQSAQLYSHGYILQVLDVFASIQFWVFYTEHGRRVHWGPLGPEWSPDPPNLEPEVFNYVHLIFTFVARPWASTGFHRSWNWSPLTWFVTTCRAFGVMLHVFLDNLGFFLYFGGARENTWCNIRWVRLLSTVCLKVSAHLSIWRHLQWFVATCPAVGVVLYAFSTTWNNCLLLRWS